MEKVKIFIRKHFLLIIMVAVLFNVSAVGIAIAYFTSVTDEVVNKFSAGDVVIEVEEPDYVPEDSKSTEPGQVVTKNPIITNTGTVSAYVFVKLEVPKVYTRVVNEQDNKTIEGPENYRLFDYNPNDDWTLLKDLNSEDENYYIYYYAYNYILDAGKTTKEALFDEVKTLNYIEGDLNETKSYYINAIGKAIQSDNIGLKTYDELGQDGYKTQMTKAYADYLKDE